MKSESDTGCCAPVAALHVEEGEVGQVSAILEFIPIKESDKKII
jgi:hypothetical protein